MRINYSSMMMLALIYLCTPIVVFFFTWLYWWGGCFLSVLLITAVCYGRSYLCDSMSEVSLGLWHLGAALLTGAFLLLTAHGGFIGAIGVDIPFRDAMYNDLLTYPWPLYYPDSGSAFVYYHVYWLVPAGISYLLCLGWTGSHVVLFFWTWLGATLSVWLLAEALQARKQWMLMVTLLFLFWGGLSILGMLPKSIIAGTALTVNDYPGFDAWQFAGGVDHGYRMDYFIRTTYDALANVYNQFVPITLVTFIWWKLRNELRVYFLFAVLILPYSPLGFAGFCLMIMGEVLSHIKQAVDWNGRELVAREILSEGNVLGFLAVVPVFFLYFTVNSRAEVAGAGILYVPWGEYSLLRIGMLLLYYLLYFGIYMLLLDKSWKRNVFFWWLVFIMIVIPLFRVGESGDFNWNASMAPFLVILMMVSEQLLVCCREKHFWGRNLLLVFFMSFTVLTPCLQMASTFRACMLEHDISVYHDPDHIGGTYVGHDQAKLQNFLVKGYEKSFFFRYLVKE